MSETANDLVLMRYELFPNLDETPREEQRDKIKQLFVGRGLIDDAIELYVSEDTVRDIDKLRFDGLTDYVERVNHRMRHGEIIDLTIPTGTLSAQELFAVIYDQLYLPAALIVVKYHLQNRLAAIEIKLLNLTITTALMRRKQYVSMQLPIPQM